MSKGPANQRGGFQAWNGYRILLAVLLAQTVVAGCKPEFTKVPSKGSTVAVTSNSTPTPTIAESETEPAGIVRPEDRQPRVLTPSVKSSPATVTDAPGNPTTVTDAAATPLPPSVATTESEKMPSPQPTWGPWDALPGGGFHRPIDDSPCNALNSNRLPLDQQWFWANAVQWHPDGSTVFFSQGPLVYSASVDGTRVMPVADASATVRTPRSTYVYGPMTSFDIAPQGDRLVYATCAYRQDAPTMLDTEYEYEIAVAELGSAAVARLTTNRNFENYPSWSPDGRRIAFVAAPRTSYNELDEATLLVIRAEGSNRQVISIDGHGVGFHPPQWSPDGTRLAVVGQEHGFRGAHAVFVGSAGGSDMQRLGGAASGPSWSPDGTRLAFVGPETFRGDERVLFTVAADGTDVQRVPLPADWQPHYAGTHGVLVSLNWIPTLAWSPAGDHLLYTCGHQVCVVTLDGTPVGRSPIELDRGSVAAWSPDGSRIAVAAGSYWIDFLVNWADPVDELLYTMAPDGSDVRLLAKYDAEGQLRAVAREPDRGDVDVAGCGAGVAVPDPTADPGLVRDCETLLRVQAAWQHSLNWDTDRSLGEWDGIVLGGSPPRVHELQLAAWILPRSSWKKLGLWGTVPPELGALDQLRVLDLSGNVLTGNIPPQLGQLTRLVKLDLSGNYLGGKVPPELGALAGLRVLALGNFLTGCVPPELPVVDREELELPDCEAETTGSPATTAEGCPWESSYGRPSASAADGGQHWL